MTTPAYQGVILAAGHGSRMGPFGTLPQHGMDYWPKGAKLVQIDADPKMLGLVKKVDVGICGDAKAAAMALLSLLSERTLACDATRTERLAAMAAEKAAWEKELAEWTHERDAYSLDMIEEAKGEKPFSGGQWLHPRQVLRELMEDDAQVVLANNKGELKAFKNADLLPAAFTEGDL